MKTTKLIIALMTLLITLASVSASMMPHPVYGVIKNDGNAVVNAQVKYENLVSGVIDYTLTDANGFYQFELGNMDAGYRESDRIKISLTTCSASTSCSMTATIGNGVSNLAFDLKDANIIPEPIVITTNECPSVPSRECVTTTCPANVCNCAATTCPSVPVCPTPTVCETNTCDNGWLTPLITGLLALIAGGGAAYVTMGNKKVKVFKKNGVNTLYHSHPYATTYHDPNTIHKSEPHKKGELLPVYEKDETGTYQYKG